MDKRKHILKLEKVLILIDLNKIFPMKLSDFEISHSIETYDTKIADN